MAVLRRLENVRMYFSTHRYFSPGVLPLNTFDLLEDIYTRKKLINHAHCDAP